MSTVVISPPVALPVALSQAKLHLRVENSDEDDFITDLIAAATLHVEAHVRQKLINRTLRQYLNAIPSGFSVCLEAGPIREITVVTGYDNSGSPVVIDPQHYKLDNAGDPSAVVFAPEAITLDVSNGIEIDFVAGFGASGVDVPANILRAILVLMAHWYEFRGAVSTLDQPVSVPVGWDILLAPVRRVRL